MDTINPLDHLSDLAVFVRVVDTQGFSAAARAMGLTKSAVSKRINRLEKQLGLRLLQRTTRAMSLTEAGRVLYERAAQGVALLDESARLAAGLVDHDDVVAVDQRVLGVAGADGAQVEQRGHALALDGAEHHHRRRVGRSPRLGLRRAARPPLPPPAAGRLPP